jgi:putative proteasome-type protease
MTDAAAGVYRGARERGSLKIRGGLVTYCLGILLPSGLVLASDSRSNAGVDQVARVRKLALITQPGNRVIAILSAGNLATTQLVVTTLR